MVMKIPAKKITITTDGPGCPVCGCKKFTIYQETPLQQLFNLALAKLGGKKANLGIHHSRIKECVQCGHKE